MHARDEAAVRQAEDLGIRLGIESPQLGIAQRLAIEVAQEKSRELRKTGIRKHTAIDRGDTFRLDSFLRQQ